jgi:general secretion pathway protein F
MRFRVRYLTGDQRIEQRWVTASDAAAALDQMHAEGYVALGARAARPVWPSGRAGFDTPLFTTQLAALLGAGLGLVESLEALADNEPTPARRELLAALLRDLRGGEPLSAVLARFPTEFPDLLCACVRAAERTGDLRAALLRYGDYRSRSDGLRRRLITALLYPLLVLAVGLAVTGFLLLAVVPRFASLIADSGRELPWATGLLFGASGSLAAQPLLWLITLAAVVAAIALMAGDASQRHALADRLVQLPLVGSLLLRQKLARFCRALALLLDGGIPLSPALDVALPLASRANDATGERLKRALQAGHPLSLALAEVGLATPLSNRLLRAGEGSGQLAAMLTRVADFHEDEVTRDVERIARVAEPLLMLALGLLIGGVVLLLYLPIFDLAGGLQ